MKYLIGLAFTAVVIFAFFLFGGFYKSAVPNAHVTFEKRSLPPNLNKEVVDLDLTADDVFANDKLFESVTDKFAAAFEHLYDESAAVVIRKNFKWKQSPEPKLFTLSLDLQPPTFGQVVLDEIMAGTKSFIDELVADETDLRERIRDLENELVKKNASMDEIFAQKQQLPAEDRTTFRLEALTKKIEELKKARAPIVSQLAELIGQKREYYNPYEFKILKKADALVTDKQVDEYRLLREKFPQLPQVKFKVSKR